MISRLKGPKDLRPRTQDTVIVMLVETAIENRTSLIARDTDMSLGTIYSGFVATMEES